LSRHLHADLAEDLREVDVLLGGQHVGMLSAGVSLDGTDLGVRNMLRRGNRRPAAEAS
jgi:hypothetical protein